MKVKINRIDKELRNFGAIMRIFSGLMSEKTMRLASKMMSKPTKIKEKDIHVEEKWIGRKDGTKMRICIFKPLFPKKNVPGVLWIHGGGYALGTPEAGISKAKTMIAISDCIVVAPDYRLSVQAPYPAALEDNYEALLWMREHSKELGIREDQLVVGGDSAGGGLTAAVSLLARDRKEVAIAFQMPLYPMIDDRMKSKSMKKNNAPVWDFKSSYIGWKMYLADLFQTDKVPAYAAAARATNFDNLPATITFVGNIEPFRDETIQYVENLKKAGVPVAFKLYKGCFHAFEVMRPKATVSKEALNFFEKSFRHAVNTYYVKQPTKEQIS
ncbi:MAG: alpha/beta hydrolase [Anaerovoracaceae bacterium]